MEIAQRGYPSKYFLLSLHSESSKIYQAPTKTQTVKKKYKTPQKNLAVFSKLEVPLLNITTLVTTSDSKEKVIHTISQDLYNCYLSNPSHSKFWNNISMPNEFFIKITMISKTIMCKMFATIQGKSRLSRSSDIKLKFKPDTKFCKKLQIIQTISHSLFVNYFILLQLLSV